MGIENVPTYGEVPSQVNKGMDEIGYNFLSVCRSGCGMTKGGVLQSS